MVKTCSSKWLPALLLGAFSGAFSGLSSASNFHLMEQNASGIGNAFAGSAAVADNASTVYFNPAGMTQLKTYEISGGGALLKPSFTFHDQGSQVGSLGNAGSGGDAGGLAVLPNIFGTWAITKDLYIGLGISAPFGLKTEYDERWQGAAQSTKFEVKTININPSIAYRVNDRVSLGFGLNWQDMNAEYKRLASVGAGSALPFGDRVTSTVKLEDSAWGWNAGALFRLSPSTKVGFSYRSKVKYKASGDIKLASDSSAQGNATLNALQANGFQSDAKSDLTMPDVFIMSVTQKLSDKWEMLGDVSWTGWSSIPKVDIMRASGMQNGLLAQRLDTDYRDAWRIALGANYQLNDTWKLKYGFAYDQTPVKHDRERLSSLPDNDRVWLSFGAQWLPNKTSTVDLGAAYIYVRDSNINNNQITNSRGHLKGDYSGSIWMLGAQYSVAF